MKRLIKFACVDVCAQLLLIVVVCNAIATAAGVYGVFFCEGTKDQMGGAAVLAEATVTWLVLVPWFFMEAREAWQKFVKRITDGE